MATMTFETSDIPADTLPRDEAPTPDLGGDFDPAYPGSTEDAPYGFKPDGTAYVRRPRGTGGSSTGSTKTATKGMPASHSAATAAANLLARLNLLMSFGLQTAGMPLTAEGIVDANEQFKVMAYESLLTDPALCKKILGAGASSGKAGLVMAYVMLGASVVPSAKTEISQARARRVLEAEGMEIIEHG